MDRTEGALLVAEKAMSETARAHKRLDDLAEVSRRLNDLEETSARLSAKSGSDADLVRRDEHASGIDGLRSSLSALRADVETLSNKEPDPDPRIEALTGEVAELRRTVADLIAKPAQPGPQGDPGIPGKDGESIRGEKGDPGRGVVDALIGADGSLVVTFTDGATKSVGIVKGDDGKDGRSVILAEIDEAGRLQLRFSDGTVQALDKVVGRDGRDGIDGAQGAPGTPGDLGPTGPMPSNEDLTRLIAVSRENGEISDTAAALKQAVSSLEAAVKNMTPRAPTTK